MKGPASSKIHHCGKRAEVLADLQCCPVNSRVPGATFLATEVRDALAHQVSDHRGDPFHQLYQDLQRRLQKTLRTAACCLLVPGGGTAGMEAAVWNLCAPGNQVVVMSNGYFGERFVAIAQRRGVQVNVLRQAFGSPFDPVDIDAFLRRFTNVRGVFFVASESSSGVLNEATVIALLVRDTCPEAILVCDAVGLAPVYEWDPDQLGIDMLIASSAKCMMGPPGYGILTLSAKASLAVTARSCSLPSTLDLALALRFHHNHELPFTPAMNVLYGLQASLKLIETEGQEDFLKRHRAAATLVRERLVGLGLSPVAPENCASPAVTAFWLPSRLDAQTLLNTVHQRGVLLGAGREPFTTRIIRFAHMGYFHQDEIAQALDALAAALRTVHRHGPQERKRV